MGPNILVVDDEASMRRSLRRLLADNGYSVRVADCAHAALGEARRERPDLVLLDIMMDWVLDGVQVTREMLRQKELLNIPIIIVSSIVDSEYRDMFPQDEYLHCDSWLDKPCPPDKLLGEMNRILSRYGRKE